MRGCFTLLIAMLFVTAVSFAQQADNSGQQTNPQQNEQQQKRDKKKKEKDHSKNKDQNSGAADELNADVFSQAVANSVLDQVRNGLVGHSPRLMLDAFDDSAMPGYLTFEDEIEALFQRHEAFRVHYRISNSAIEANKGVVMVDWQMEELPRDGGTPMRRDGQIRFEFTRTRKGWKISDFNPRGIFS